MTCTRPLLRVDLSSSRRGWQLACPTLLLANIFVCLVTQAATIPSLQATRMPPPPPPPPGSCAWQVPKHCPSVNNHCMPAWFCNDSGDCTCPGNDPAKPYCNAMTKQCGAPPPPSTKPPVSQPQATTACNQYQSANVDQSASQNNSSKSRTSHRLNACNGVAIASATCCWSQAPMLQRRQRNVHQQPNSVSNQQRAGGLRPG